MTVIKFIRDFQGWATGNQFYTAGEVVDLPDWQAKQCVSEAAAEWVVSEQAPTPPAAEPPRKLSRPKGKKAA